MSEFSDSDASPQGPEHPSVADPPPGSGVSQNPPPPSAPVPATQFPAAPFPPPSPPFPAGPGPGDLAPPPSPPAPDAPPSPTTPPFFAPAAPGTDPFDSWTWPAPGEGAGGLGGGIGPPGPWGPLAQRPQPWDGAGPWRHGQWGGPPIWIPPHQPRRNNPLRVLAVSAAVVLVAVLGVAVGRVSIQNQTGSGSPFNILPATGAAGGSGSSGAADTGTIAAKVDPGVVDITDATRVQRG